MAGEPTERLVLPLDRRHDRADFSCGRPALDAYLKQIALQDARRNIAAPFVLVAEAAPTKIIGYYTLSSYAVDAGELPDALARRLPRYKHIPATLLGRLAVDVRYRGRGHAEFLLMHALETALGQSRRIASVAVVVDAIDDSAASFYRHFDFLSLPATPRRLFLPMSDIAELFE